MPRWSATSARASRCSPIGSRASSIRIRHFLPLREEILDRINDRADEDRFPVTPQRIVHDVRKVMPEDGIVCLDNGMYKIWFARNYRTHVANTLLLDNALATMGAGLPSAMMAALLYPDRRVMAVCGDGGFMMNSQELETAVRLKLNLVVLDPERRRLRHDPLEAGGRRLPGLRPDLRQSGFRQIRGGLWRQGIARITATDELAPTLEAAFKAGGVHLVAVPIDYSENTRVLSRNCGAASRSSPT